MSNVETVVGQLVPAGPSPLAHASGDRVESIQHIMPRPVDDEVVEHVKELATAALAIERRFGGGQFTDKLRYRIPYGSALGTGLSVIVAEELANFVGGIERRSTPGPVQYDEKGNKFCMVEGSATDLRNMRREIVSRVAHGYQMVKDGKGGKTMRVFDAAEWDREIAKVSGIVKRDATFKLFSRTLLWQLEEAIGAVQVDDTRDRFQKSKKEKKQDVDKLIAALTKLSPELTVARIEAKIGCPVAKMTPEQYVELKECGASIRDKVATIDELFPVSNGNSNGGEPTKPELPKDAKLDCTALVASAMVAMQANKVEQWCADHAAELALFNQQADADQMSAMKDILGNW